MHTGCNFAIGQLAFVKHVAFVIMSAAYLLGLFKGVKSMSFSTLANGLHWLFVTD